MQVLFIVIQWADLKCTEVTFELNLEAISCLLSFLSSNGLAYEITVPSVGPPFLQI
jgi:hypothetical protein